MTIFTLSGLLTAVTSLALGAFVLWKNSRCPINRLWCLFTVSVAGWGAGSAWIGSELNPAHSLLAWRLSFALCVVWIPILFYHFVVSFCGLPHSRQIHLQYVIGLTCVPFIVFSPSFFTGPRFVFESFYYAMPGSILFYAFVMWWAWLVTYAHYQAIRVYRQAGGIKRQQLKYFLVGFTISYATGSLDYLPFFHVDLYPYGNFGIVVYPVLMTYAIVKYRVMDITVALEKSLAYLVVVGVLAIPAYLVCLYAQRAQFGYVDPAFSLILLGLFIVVIAFTYRVKAAAASTVGRTLFRHRHARLETLSEFAKSLVTLLELTRLSEEIVRTLATTWTAATAALYLVDTDKNHYTLTGAWGHTKRPDETLRMTDALPVSLQTAPRLIVSDELGHEPNSTNRMLQAALQTLEAELCLPLVRKDLLIGFCTLGARSSGNAYTADDLSLLRSLVDQAAIAVDNALLYERLRRSQAVVLRTDRLRSLETMAAGFAHEIRNPLTSIKTFVELAPDRADDAEFLHDFGKIVADDVARIERLIKEILDYARQGQRQVTQEDLNELVGSTIYFLEVKATQRNITIVKNFASKLPLAPVDRQQIKQVLLNLFLNAFDAMPGGGQLVVDTRPLSRQRAADWIQIDVRDTGCGIASQDLNHIFDPFYTTKHESSEREGTGLGLTIANQIIHNHGGYIEVSSRVGHGTTFSVCLPVHNLKPEKIAPVHQQAAGHP